VKVAYNVYGLYDIITQIEAETQDELRAHGPAPGFSKDMFLK
jgi:hypothetical protein